MNSKNFEEREESKHTPNDYLLGVDIGTLGSKGILIDAEGKVLAEHYAEHDVNVIRPGWVEQDPETCYWGDFKKIVKNLFRTSGVDPKNLAGIGVSGLTPDAAPVDKSAKPVRPCIIYMDRRAHEECEWTRENIGFEKAFKISGNTLDPYFAGYKILWYRRNEPDNYARTWKILNADKFVILKLTGESVIDYGVATITAPLFDYQKKKWSEEICQAMEIDIEKLPTPYYCHEVVGEVTSQAENETGIPKGTPVIAGGPDAMFSLLSVGGTKDGESCFSYGTTGCWVIVQDEPRFDPRLINTYYAVPDKYVSAGGMIAVGALVRWFRDQFGHVEKSVSAPLGISAYKVLDLEAEKVPAGCDGLVVLPYFMGERTPIWDTEAKGVILGLTLYHTRAHVYRALLESAGYGLRHHMEITKAIGINVKEIIAVDGGAKSRLWRQIVTDITGFPQSYAPDVLGAPFGDAFLAGVGVGMFKDFESIKKFVEIKDETKPNRKSYEVYSKLYNAYRNLYEHTKNDAHAIHKLLYGP